jgi:hypothetical protein
MLTYSYDAVERKFTGKERDTDVRPEDGGGYGRVFEFVVAAHFGELIPVLPAGN